MPTFAYEAMTPQGKQAKGTLEAKTSDDALAQLRQQGMFPTSVREQKTKGGPTTATEAAGKKKKKGFSLSLGGVSTKNLPCSRASSAPSRMQAFRCCAASRSSRCSRSLESSSARSPMCVTT